uniref:Uncharacterized protein n=1 Tax=viral metagenome TaxID=1070528 RepID=A0A6H2A5J6_9ZZZZ
MKKEYTKEERAAYYKALRERWQAAKNVGDEDEVKAVMMQHGLNFSFRSYMFVKMQMNALGLDGIPYVDAKTFMGWKENGFMVRKGEKSQIDGLTWIAINGKETEAPAEGESENHGFVMPKCYHLFHRTQVDAIA